MKRIYLLMALVACTHSHISAQQSEVLTSAKSADEQIIDSLFKTALTKSEVYGWLRELCLDIGPRLSGSKNADKAVQWSYELMDKLGLEPQKQEVMVPVWKRGSLEMAIAHSKDTNVNLSVCALGGSVGTPGMGIQTQVVEVASFEELAEMPEEKVEGKIVFFNTPMNPENLYTFHSYGSCVSHRWEGAVQASHKGAVASIVRSLNLRIDSFPHTGSMTYEGATKKIPAAAVSTRDAEVLSKMLKKDKKLRLRFGLQCETLPDKLSHNVYGEIKGSEYPDEIIMVGGHLDSWDLGQGAHDDGAGVMQSLGALQLLQQIGYKPKRTIRVVFFMNEENGLRGAKKYAEETERKGENHIAAIESDRGGFTPRGFHMDGPEASVERMKQWKPILEPYGLHQLEEGGTGADIHPLKRDDNLLIGFVPDSQRYFDVHHAASDTFDSVNKRELELGTASIAAMVYLLDQYGIGD